MKTPGMVFLGLALLACEASAEKASPPLSVDLHLDLPRSFPGNATATLTAACHVAAGSLTMRLDLPAAYCWIAGATRLVDPPVLSATHVLVVGFHVESPTREPILGSAALDAGGGLRVLRSAQISLLPDDTKAQAENQPAAFEDKDGVARYPGRTRLRAR